VKLAHAIQAISEEKAAFAPDVASILVDQIRNKTSDITWTSKGQRMTAYVPAAVTVEVRELPSCRIAHGAARSSSTPKRRRRS
jgi:hypothetical protein